jgi:hypothetical protein
VASARSQTRKTRTAGICREQIFDVIHEIVDSADLVVLLFPNHLPTLAPRHRAEETVKWR